MGLDQMYLLTMNNQFKLRVTMKKFDQEMRIETYTSFKILENVIIIILLIYFKFWILFSSNLIFNEERLVWKLTFYSLIIELQFKISQTSLYHINLFYIRSTTHFKLRELLQMGWCIKMEVNYQLLTMTMMKEEAIVHLHIMLDGG